VAELLCGHPSRYLYSYRKSCCLLDLKDSKDSKDTGEGLYGIERKSVIGLERKDITNSASNQDAIRVMSKLLSHIAPEVEDKVVIIPIRQIFGTRSHLCQEVL
jgi:hypothetical protein